MNVVFLVDIVKSIHDAFHDQGCLVFGVERFAEGHLLVFFEAELVLPEFEWLSKTKHELGLLLLIVLLVEGFILILLIAFLLIGLVRRVLVVVVVVGIGVKVILLSGSMTRLLGPVTHLPFHLHAFEVLHLDYDVFLCFEDVHELHNVTKADEVTKDARFGL